MKPTSKAFQKKLNAYYPDKPLTDEEVAEAFLNLGEFIIPLVKINKREHIVPMEELTEERGGSGNKCVNT